MNNYEEWAQLVAKKLEHESTLLAAIDKEELDDAAASEAFVRAVLKPFLPENFGIGSGRIVDAFGNCSDYLEIIVYNQDFPRIGMRGTHSAFLYESVLAAFSIRAKFIRKTFFESLNACASLARLETNVDKTALVKLAVKNGLKAGPNKTFVHQDPLRTARFELIGRPPSFVFGFSGFKYSYRQLQENIELWLDNRVGSGTATPMKCLPAVIATQGCFAWRNAAPLALSNREMLGVGADDAPIRLIVLQLLYLLNRRLQVNSVDGYGLKPSLNAYLSHFSVPRFEVGVGNLAEVVNLKPAKPAEPRAQAPAARPEPKTSAPVPGQTASAAKAKAAAPVEAKTAAPEKARQPAPAAKPAEAAKPVQAAPKPPAPPKQPASTETSGVFDKPSPFAAKPRPREAAPQDAPEPRRWSAPSAPLGSAPIPQDPTPAVDKAPSRTPLGSAPIPPAQEPAKPQEPAPAAQVIPPKPPVDFDLGGTEEKPAESRGDDEGNEFTQTVVIPPGDDDETKAEARKPAEQKPAEQKPAEAAASAKSAETDFESTVIIPPDASGSINEKSKKSGDDFIARVKEQLSSAEPIGDDKKDFTSTIPQ